MPSRVDRQPAAVHPDSIVPQWRELFFSTGQGVVQTHLNWELGTGSWANPEVGG